MTIFLNAPVVGKKKDHVASSAASRTVEAEIAWSVDVGKEEDSLAGGGDDSADGAHAQPPRRRYQSTGPVVSASSA